MFLENDETMLYRHLRTAPARQHHPIWAPLRCTPGQRKIHRPLGPWENEWINNGATFIYLNLRMDEKRNHFHLNMDFKEKQCNKYSKSLVKGLAKPLIRQGKIRFEFVVLFG